MYISGLEKNKVKEFTDLFDKTDISYEVWDEETSRSFTLFTNDYNRITLNLGGAFNILAVFNNRICESEKLKIIGSVHFKNDEYYQVTY